MKQEWNKKMEEVLNELLYHPMAMEDLAPKVKEAMSKKENVDRVKEAMIKSRNLALERCPKLEDNYVKTGKKSRWDYRIELSQVPVTVGEVTIKFGAVITCNGDFHGTQTEYYEFMKKSYEKGSLTYVIVPSEVTKEIQKVKTTIREAPKTILSRWTPTMKQYIGWGILILFSILISAELSHGWIVIAALAAALCLLKQAKEEKDVTKVETTLENERRKRLYQTDCLCMSVVQYEKIRRLVVWGDELENELYVVEKNEKLGVIDERGNKILPCEYDFIDYSTHELQHEKTVSFIIVKKDGLFQLYKLKEKKFGPKAEHITY